MFIFLACMLLDSWRDWTFILENKVVRSPPYIAPHIAHAPLSICKFNILHSPNTSLTRPSALGMSDPIWGPLIHIFVDEKKKCEG